MALDQAASTLKRHPDRSMPLAEAEGRIRPELLEVIREGYSWGAYWRDASAGFTVATVALPVSMAFAIASGVSPERGLYASIVGGGLVSALGGTRVMIAGPAGVLVALNAAALKLHGLEGLLAASMLSGLTLVALGVLRLGRLVDRVPRPVIVGFTAGIAMTTFVSQWKDLGALRVQGPTASSFLERLVALAAAFPTASPAAVALGLGTAALTALLGRYRPRWPSMLLALVAATALTASAGLHVATVGSRFGDLPPGFPLPHLPHTTGATLIHLVPTAISLALLSGVESLLSAKVADGMTGRPTRPDTELVGQGIANMAAAAYGGLPVIGVVARTVANIEAGGRTPLAGIMHAAFLWAFLAFAAPLARFVPLPALAGLVAFVCWRMIPTAAIAALVTNCGSALVALVAAVFTLLNGSTAGLTAGSLVACALRVSRLLFNKGTSRKRA